MLPRTDDRKTGGQLVTAPDVVHQRLLGRMVGQTSIIDGDTLEIHGTRSRLWGSDAPESTQFCRGEDSLPYPKRGKFCERWSDERD
jgi:endonuclease YncB( thermonuclease family)